MAEDQGKQEEEKLEFTAEGEALGYISLDQAGVLAMRTASETPGAYGATFQNVLMAFEVERAEDTEDHYVITLSVRPQGQFRPGREQFFVEKEGSIAYRQVLAVPRQGRRIPVLPIGIGVVVVGVIAMAAVITIGGPGDENAFSPSPTAVVLGRTSAPLTTSTESATPSSTLAAPPVVLSTPLSTSIGIRSDAAFIACLGERLGNDIATMIVTMPNAPLTIVEKEVVADCISTPTVVATSAPASTRAPVPTSAPAATSAPANTSAPAATQAPPPTSAPAATATRTIAAIPTPTATPSWSPWIVEDNVRRMILYCKQAVGRAYGGATTLAFDTTYLGEERWAVEPYWAYSPDAFMSYGTWEVNSAWGTVRPADRRAENVLEDDDQCGLPPGISPIIGTTPTPTTVPDGRPNPHVFLGKVTIEGVPAPNRMPVSAWIGGAMAGVTTVNSGRYMLVVELPRGDPNVSHPISFQIGGRWINQFWGWQSGEEDELDLTLN